MTTGFSDADAQLIRARAGDRCEGCGTARPEHTHHRTPRRAGGTTGERAARVNSVPNGLRLCWRCHNDAESDRDGAYEIGWLVAEHDDPAIVPAKLTIWCGTGWFQLTDWGGYRILELTERPRLA